MKRWPTWTCSGRTTSSTRASTARSTVWPKVKSRGVRVSRAESLYGREEFQTFGRVRALRLWVCAQAGLARADSEGRAAEGTQPQGGVYSFERAATELGFWGGGSLSGTEIGRGHV